MPFFGIFFLIFWLVLSRQLMSAVVALLLLLNFMFLLFFQTNQSRIICVMNFCDLCWNLGSNWVVFASGIAILGKKWGDQHAVMMLYSSIIKFLWFVCQNFWNCWWNWMANKRGRRGLLDAVWAWDIGLKWEHWNRIYCVELKEAGEH